MEMKRCARKEAVEGGRGSDVHREREQGRRLEEKRGGQRMEPGEGRSTSAAGRFKRLPASRP